MTRPSHSAYEFGPFIIDEARRLLLRHGESVPLTPKCFEILIALVENRGQVVSKDDLMKRVWPDRFVEEGNLTYNISVLRKALGERAGEHQYIVTVPGTGYQFIEMMMTDPAVTGPERSTTVVAHEENSRSQVGTAFVGEGTVPTTSARGPLFSVVHDTTLVGNGTVGSPLGVAVRLILSGSVSERGVIETANTAVLGSGVEATGGLGCSGVRADGGDSNIISAEGGSGVSATGGSGTGVNGGGGVAGFYKYLVHAAIESSEVLNIYSGNTVTDGGGEAVITLPAWFEVLNKDLSYHLTVIGTFAQAIVASELNNHRFTIRTNAPNVKVSWQVTGVRSDAVMRNYPFQAEQEKPERERGTYLHPEAFDQPEERGAEWARHHELMRQMKQRREALKPKIERK